MFMALVILISFTYGYIAAVKHADILDKREARQRAEMNAPVHEDHSHVQPSTILNYDN